MFQNQLTYQSKIMFLKIIRFVIQTYQLMISPLLGCNCRYTPSCSHYTLEALETHGAGKGMYLAFRRILRCHPFSNSGHDPVPPKI